MKIAYLFGNGFDLNLGLKTSYKDFYLYYVKQESKSTTIKKFKEEISKDWIKWSDLEASLGDYTKQIGGLSELDEIHEDLLNHLAEYLNTVEEKFESENNQSLKKKVFLNYLFQPHLYIAERDRQALINFYGKKSTNPYIYNIVSFNYTHIIEWILGINKQNRTHSMNITEKIYNVTHRLISINHIHGSCDRHMVLGVNDKDQINNQNLSSNVYAQQQLIKSSCNEVMKHGIDLQVQKIISEVDLICIFGSSIGETDKIWWEDVASQLRNRECKLIIFEHNSNFNERRAHLQERFKNLILSKFFNNEEIAELSEHVYVSINSDIFQFPTE